MTEIRFETLAKKLRSLLDSGKTYTAKQLRDGVNTTLAKNKDGAVVFEKDADRKIIIWYVDYEGNYLWCY